jgi:nucleoside-diphosphate-sugar epimerase
MRVLVLGSSGTCGRSVCRAFAAAGHEVVPWDIALSPAHDLRVAGCLDAVLPTVDFVVFLAFDVGGAKYIAASTTAYIDNNVLLLHHTFASLKKAGLPFIHTTSTMSSMTHIPYAVLKRLSEFYTELLGGINLKLWNVYGSEPIGIKSHVIPDLIDQAKEGVMRLRTDGEEKRLFLHADDFARGVVAVFDNYEALRGRVIDISVTDWVSILDVARMVQSVAREVLHLEVAIEVSTTKDQSHTHRTDPDVAPLAAYWSPTIALKDGIRSMFLI